MNQVTANNPELLNAILDQLIYQEDGSIKINQEAFDLIDVFVERYFNTDFAQVIINSLKPDTDLRKTARILDILIWSTPDNGVKLRRLISNWIRSGDKTKVEIILKREDEFPGENIEKNKGVLEKVKMQFPCFKNLCDYHISEFEYWSKTNNRRMGLFYAMLSETKK